VGICGDHYYFTLGDFGFFAFFGLAGFDSVLLRLPGALALAVLAPPVEAEAAAATAAAPVAAPPAAAAALPTKP
jgi:hypothetical protein